MTDAPRPLAALPPIAGLALAATAAQAQDLPGDPAAGLAFAEEVCAGCHQVAGSPAMPPAEGAPPPFELIADDPAVTEMALRVFFQTPHANMPDIALTPKQMDDVIAYILSLKEEHI